MLIFINLDRISIKFMEKIIQLLSYVYIVVFICSHQSVAIDTFGNLYFNFICFRNPNNLIPDGQGCDIGNNNCDPYFKICISDQIISGPIHENKCLLYYKVTGRFSDTVNVCQESKDNRGELKNEIIIKLRAPLQKIYVKIEVIDYDSIGQPDDIASFVVKIIMKPSENLSNIIYKSVNMDRAEASFKNSGASLKIKMALQCEKHRFGVDCSNYCLARLEDNFLCSKDGIKICKEGWKGDKCMQKDLCLYQACQKNATCKEIGNKAECICQNGETGPQCYPDYDPCLNKSCKNDGNCIPHLFNNMEWKCNCDYRYYGTYCEMKIDICSLEPCFNNATCGYDINYNRICNCTDGFTGKLCDVIEDSINQDSFNNKSYISIILSCFFGILVFVLLILILVRFIRKSNKELKFKNFNSSNQVVVMSNLTTSQNVKNVNFNETLQTQPYSPSNISPTTYATIDEFLTYDKIDDEDDYMVPSMHNAEDLNKNGVIDSPVYLDMSNSFIQFPENDQKLIINKKHSNIEMEKPDLPARNLRKMSLKTFCLP